MGLFDGIGGRRPHRGERRHRGPLRLACAPRPRRFGPGAIRRCHRTRLRAIRSPHHPQGRPQPGGERPPPPAGGRRTAHRAAGSRRAPPRSDPLPAGASSRTRTGGRDGRPRTPSTPLPIRRRRRRPRPAPPFARTSAAAGGAIRALPPLASASPSRPTKPFRSSTRMSSTAGAPPAPRSCFFRPLPMSLRPPSATPAGFPAAIPSFMPAALRRPPLSRRPSRFRRNAPVHGECGGYMVLGRSLEDATGEVHPMAGLLPVATSYAKRKLHLGYRVATLLRDGPLGRPARGSSATNSTMRRSSKRTCGRKSRSARLPMPKATQSARPGTASPG